MNKKLCVVLYFAAYFREEIFQRIDSTFDCDWYVGKNLEFKTREGVKEMDTSILSRVFPLKNKTFLKAPFYWAHGMIPLLLKKEYKCYLVEGCVNCASLWIFLLLAKMFPGKKVNLWSIAWDGREKWYEKRLKKIFFGLADATFVYSEKARNLMINEGLEGNKLFAIHNSLAYGKQIALRNSIATSDIYKRHFGNDNKTIILIGRLVERKRPDVIIDAVRHLKEKGEQFNVVFVGDGEIRPKLERLCEESDLARQIWFYGACYDERTNAELIHNADICVSPGIVGLTSIHAMMFGTPVITRDTRYYQAPEAEAIKEGITGMFIDQTSPQELADAISDWFRRQGNDRDKIRENCYAEIDAHWNPQFQINVLKNHIKGLE